MASDLTYTVFIGVNYASGRSKNFDEFTGSMADVAMHEVMIMSDEIGLGATGFTFTVNVNRPVDEEPAPAK